MKNLTIRKGFEAFECKFGPFEPNIKHSNASSKGILSIQMHLLAIKKGF